jgi:hypothetical protein
MRYTQHVNTTPGRGSRLWAILLALLLLFVGLSAHASGGPTYRYGAVFTRGLILGPGNQPIYVEYDNNGAQGSEIGEAVGPLAKAQVMATIQYNAYLLQLQQLKGDYPNLELLYRDNYVSGGYTTLDGQAIGKRELAASTLSVALMPPDQRYSTDPEQLILLELPIDPSRQPEDDSRSLLLGEDGAILWDSSLNIG